MVEVHYHALVLDLLDKTHHVVALRVAHRDLAADEEYLLGDLAVHHEYGLGELDHRLGYGLAVAVLGFEREGHILARLLAHYGGFELGQQHARAADKFEGFARLRLIGYLAVDGKAVVYRNHLVRFYFH